MPFPSRPLRLFLAALAIVSAMWGADAQTKRNAVLFSAAHHNTIGGNNLLLVNGASLLLLSDGVSTLCLSGGC